ncbi:MAG: nuclear transport factor 2 family protein [Acidobacteria bacterium]|nr:nuclear transport factor 2 family protein [Acidobacteriota bacterium]
MKKIAPLCFVLLSLLATTTFAESMPSKGTALLFKLEAEFAQAVAEHGHAAFVSYFAEDGVELDNGGGITSRDEIAKQPAWPEGTSLTWTPVRGDMAASGDLGYTFGNYVFKSKDKDGKIVASYGKYMSVWKKQKGGAWKVVVDMGNSSPEPK